MYLADYAAEGNQGYVSVDDAKSECKKGATFYLNKYLVKKTDITQ